MEVHLQDDRIFFVMNISSIISLQHLPISGVIKPYSTIPEVGSTNEHTYKNTQTHTHIHTHTHSQTFIYIHTFVHKLFTKANS